MLSTFCLLTWPLLSVLNKMTVRTGHSKWFILAFAPSRKQLPEPQNVNEILIFFSPKSIFHNIKWQFSMAIMFTCFIFSPRTSSNHLHLSIFCSLHIFIVIIIIMIISITIAATTYWVMETARPSTRHFKTHSCNSHYNPVVGNIICILKMNKQAQRGQVTRPGFKLERDRAAMGT